MWRNLGVMGSAKMEDRLAALNLLLFTVALADGHYCPRRPREFVGRMVEESLASEGHLDLWMKDLSPVDCRVSGILRSCHRLDRDNICVCATPDRVRVSFMGYLCLTPSSPAHGT